MAEAETIEEADDTRIPFGFRELRYWRQGFETAQSWYHEEWDGSYIQLQLGMRIARAIEEEVEATFRGKDDAGTDS